MDWDDNILRMPTRLYLKDDEGNVVGMPTDHFAEYRHLIGKEPFEYEGHSIVGFDNDGLIIPDPLLKAQDKLGILNAPRQTMLVNRIGALQVYVQTLNSILVSYPVLLIATPSSLLSEDPLPTTGFDTQTDSVTNLSYLDTNAFPNGYKILIPSDATYQGKWSIYSFNSTNDSFELFKLQSYLLVNILTD